MEQETINSITNPITYNILFAILFFLSALVFGLFVFVIKLLSDKHKLVTSVKLMADDKLSDKDKDLNNFYEIINMYNNSNTHIIQSLDNINKVLKSIENNRT